jgi:hypothetical protein
MESEVDMKNGKQNGWRNIIDELLFIVVLVGILLVPYLLSISEPAKVFIFGAALVGLTVWAKKHFKRRVSRKL